jgi:hypothetical protein
METIVRLDGGCSPDAAVSDAILLESEYSTFLVFRAQRQPDSGCDDAGWAVVEFDSCSITKFGYPNDEARSAIPRLTGVSYDFYEVIDSEWRSEINHLNRFGFPNLPDLLEDRHFLITFHDSTFECLASGMHVTLTAEPLSKVIAELSTRIIPGDPSDV